jgi:HSP20 family protein
MRLSRWEPFKATEDLFNQLAPELFGRWSRLRLPAGLESKLEWSPSANVSETDQEYVIRADLPAVKKEDIKVSVHEGVITIEGERKQREEEKTEKMHRVESYWGSFSRSFALPENVNADAVRCETKDGLLTVRVPKVVKATSQARQIKVE